MAVSDAAWAWALDRSLALSFLVGGLSALAYFPTVSRAMPSFCAMVRRESPCSLACCTASQRTCWVSVGVRCNWWRAAKDGEQRHLAHGHRGRRPANAIPETTGSRVGHLARTVYEGANHTHLSELLSER